MKKSIRQFLYLILFFIIFILIAQLARNSPTELKYQDVFIALGSIGGIISAIVTVYRWIWIPHKTRANEIINHVFSPINKKLQAITHEIETFENVNTEYFNEDITSTNTPVKLREKLKEIRVQIEDYEGWLEETDLLLRYHIESKVAKYEDLTTDWEVFGIGRLLDVLKSCTRIPIYEGNLTQNYVIEHLLNLHGRGLEKKITSSTRGDRIIKLKELLESDEMYRIINSIKDLEKSRSIKMMKDARAKLLAKINDNCKWLQSRIESL
jgi:ACT domain-containing protein